MSVDDPDASDDLRLKELGYEPSMHRRLHWIQVVGLSMADVSPTMAVVFFSAGVFSIAGTFQIGIGIIQGLVVVLITFCLAELATMFPLAGGMYSLVRHVLPGPISWITLFNFLLQGIILPSSICLGIPPLLTNLLGHPLLGIPDTWLALILLLLAAGIALVRVELGSAVTAVMVIVELVVLTIITVGSLTHIHRNVLTATFHPVTLHGSTLMTVGGGLMLASIAAQFNVNNGYDASVGFTEELKGGARSVAKTVITAGVCAGAFIMIPLTSAIIAAPNLKDFLSAPTPITYSVTQSLGSWAGNVVDIGAAIALFNAVISLEMYMGRAYYATGRDGAWPPPVSRALGKLNRFNVPGMAIVVMTVPACILMFLSALNFLIILGGTIITAVYCAIGIAAIWARYSLRDTTRHFKVPFWPVPPIIVIIFTGIAIAKAEAQYLIAELVIIAIALIMWGLSHLWTPPRETPSDLDAESAPPLQAP